MISVDVLIVGGGLVGGTLAVALLQKGVRFCVVEGSEPEFLLDPKADARWSAIAAGSRTFLQKIGVWADIGPQSQEIHDIRVCDQNSPHVLDFQGSGPLGFMAENRVFRHALYDRIPRDVLLAPARVVTLERSEGGVQATLDNGQRIRASLVVGADGRNSAVRKHAGIGVIRHDYGQTALVQTIHHTEPHDGLAVELFLPGGPFAILPLPGPRSLIVWSERRSLVPGLLAASEAVYRAELCERVGPFLGTVTPEGRPHTYPLGLMYARRTTDQRLILVGDAAHGMHPVAGQGVNYGLRDAAVLATLLSEGHSLGQDLGTPALLRSYDRQRRPDTLAILAATHALVRLFSNRHPLLGPLRRLGLSTVNHLGPVKSFLMDQAMGQRMLGPIPPLMRGPGRLASPGQGSGAAAPDGSRRPT